MGVQVPDGEDPQAPLDPQELSTFGKIRQLLEEELGVPAYPDVYTGGDLNCWATYNLAEQYGELFGDDAPGEVIDSVQVHLFVATNQNYLGLMRDIRDGLFDYGFTWPDITTLFESDQKLRHIVFETSIEGE